MYMYVRVWILILTIVQAVRLLSPRYSSLGDPRQVAVAVEAFVLYKNKFCTTRARSPLEWEKCII